MSTCIYCRGAGPFSTVEHPIPESLGGFDLTTSGCVCDGCQNYLAREVEAPALCHTPFGFWRAHLGIPTKKGRLAKSDTRPPRSGGVIDTNGGREQPGFTIEATKEGIPAVSFHSNDGLTISDSGKRMSYTFRFTSWHIYVVGRFLGKMAIGAMSSRDLNLALSKEWDELRAYVRRGFVSELWPVFRQTFGSLDDLVAVKRISEDTYERHVRLPAHSFLPVDSPAVFIFWIGNELWMLNTTSKTRDLPVRVGKPLVEPTCIWVSCPRGHPQPPDQQTAE